MDKKIVIAVGGASGAIYAKVLLDKLTALQSQFSALGVVMSDNAKLIWEAELGNKDYAAYPFSYYDQQDFMAPFASGSAKYTDMVICPCSMGLIGRIAAGTSEGLVARAADVILKERRRLILVPRDTPYSLVHLRNMQTVTEAGGIICPASPSFYSHPSNFEELAATVIDRVIDLMELRQDTYRWGE